MNTVEPEKTWDDVFEKESASLHKEDHVEAEQDHAPSPPASWLIDAADFSAEPAPIRWLIRGWVQCDALHMVFGPSGEGKTFTVLDWAMHIASGLPAWQGCRVHQGAVVYLAGEGHHGLRGRIKAWMQHFEPSASLPLHFSRSGCDLNLPAGFNKVISGIDALATKPVLIVVDTLARFLVGDENTTEDAGTMIKACGALQARYGCAVILVHHTGVSGEAQHRGRGSSAWKAACDIVNKVSRNGDPVTIHVEQDKAKDSEPAKPLTVKIKQVVIDGWTDEDGHAYTSGVIVKAEEPISFNLGGDPFHVSAKAPKAKAESKGEKEAKRDDELFDLLARAWSKAGAPRDKGAPFVSAKALSAYLRDEESWSQSETTKALSATAKGEQALFSRLKAKGWMNAHTAKEKSGDVAGFIITGEKAAELMDSPQS